MNRSDNDSHHAPMRLLYPREMLDLIFEDRGFALDPEARETLFSLVDGVFFASMMLEEGEAVRIAVVHAEGGATELARVRDGSSSAHDGLALDLAWDVSEVAQIPFEPRALAKLSPGLQYGTHLVVVGGRAPNLFINGIARRRPRTDGGEVTRFAAPRPGVVVFERRDVELLRFDAGRSFRPAADVFSDACPLRARISAITGNSGAGTSGYSVEEWALLRLIHKMRATGHGGILAMLAESPPERVLSEVRYRRADPRLLANRIRDEREVTKSWAGSLASLSDASISLAQVRAGIDLRAARDSARDAVEGAIDDIARLSAIDLAVLVGPNLSVFGAGYHIPGSHVVPLKALNAEGTKTMAFTQAYGARHHAAFSFANENRGAVAFVVSEDGPVSCATKIGDQVVVWRVHVSET